MEKRFWAAVLKTNTCWLWQNVLDKDGYGKINYPGPKGGYERAHRYSWELHYGPVPEGMQVLHNCDNPPCVNPAHLFLGTNADNVADRISKGRNRKPSINLAEVARFSAKEVQDKFGISESWAYALRRRAN